MAKKKKAVASKRNSPAQKMKGLNDAFTGTDLKELLSQGKVTI